MRALSPAPRPFCVLASEAASTSRQPSRARERCSLICISPPPAARASLVWRHLYGQSARRHGNAAWPGRQRLETGNRRIIVESSILYEIFKFNQSTRQPIATTVTCEPLNRITQCHFQRPLENLQGWQLHHLCSQFQCLITQTKKKINLVLNLNLHYPSLRSFPLSLSL